MRPYPARAGTAVDRLMSAATGLLIKFAKFGVVGAFAFIVDVGLFNLLSHVGASPVFADQPLLAKVVSSAAATVVAWTGNRLWTFRQNRREDLVREFVLYAVMCTIGLGIALFCLWVSHYVFGFTSLLADNIAANVVGVAAGTIFRFWAYQRFVFVRSSPDDLPSAGDAADVDESSRTAVQSSIR